MNVYRHCLRPLLFRVDPEKAHNRVLGACAELGRYRIGRWMARRCWADRHDARLSMELEGLTFPNPLGLAAGFDKSGRAVAALAAAGFGSVEIGSVSAHPSAGNPRPRLFRLPDDEAIVVNYGVPNDGAAVVADRIAHVPRRVPLGVNLVETNTGQPLDPDGVVDELVEAARHFCGGQADYLTINLNCPNTTAGVSPFDDGMRVADLLAGLSGLPGLPPVFLKFTAHVDEVRADNLLQAVDRYGCVVGFIFNLPPGTNYALRSAQGLVDTLPGTLCGPPTRSMMDDALGFWYGRIDRSRHVLVGSGGIASADDAWRKICLGASLLQLYTALIYHGPGVLRSILSGLRQRLERHDLAHLTEAVGLAHEPSSPVLQEST